MTLIRPFLPVLAALALAAPALAENAPADSPAVSIIGLTSHSISFQPDGGTPFTCSLTRTLGASLGALRLVPGLKVKVACKADGHGLVLVSVKRLEPQPVAPPVTTTKNTYGQGTVAATTATSISVTTDGGVLTCSLTNAQASSLGPDVHVGVRVKIACRQDGTRLVFVGIAPAETTVAPRPVTTAPTTTAPAPVTREVAGTVTALRKDALVVVGESGVSVTCLFGPELAAKIAALGVAVGARVHVACTAYGERVYLVSLAKA